MKPSAHEAPSPVDEKVLIAHEWLAPTGGSESTVEQMMATLPGARLVCLWNDAPERFPTADETWLARSPFRRSKAASLAVMHHAWQKVPLSGVETVVASSHAMSHHIAGRAAREGLGAYAYIYSPPRYLWATNIDARGQGLLARSGGQLARRLDRKGIDTRVKYCAISEFVRERMADAWGVESVVIHPPVETTRLLSVADWSTRLDEREQGVLDALPDTFVLGASRLIEYKRLDVSIRVGEQLGLPVVIAGDGDFRRQLEQVAEGASVPVHFVGRASDELLFSLYQRTVLFVFMPIEDFGIMPVEAMALGAPVLMRSIGGAAEISRLVDAGVIVDPGQPEELAIAARAAIERGAADAQRVAATFSVERFRREFAAFVTR